MSPNRPLRPCSCSRCPNAVRPPARYCDAHKGYERAIAPRHEARQPDNRPSAAARGYDAKWRAASKEFLAAHPYCECDTCLRLGRLLPASVVHHMIPHRGDMQLFWDQANWRAMSKRCHDRHTSSTKRGG